jgi:hypothetical protein
MIPLPVGVNVFSASTTSVPAQSGKLELGQVVELGQFGLPAQAGKRPLGPIPMKVSFVVILLDADKTTHGSVPHRKYLQAVDSALRAVQLRDEQSLGRAAVPENLEALTT